MSSHSNDSMVVINPDDLDEEITPSSEEEESPPPEDLTVEDKTDDHNDAKDDNVKEFEPLVIQHQALLENKSSEDIEQVGEINEVEEKLETIEIVSKTEEKLAANPNIGWCGVVDDDPPIEILEAPASVTEQTEDKLAANQTTGWCGVVDDPPIEILETPPSVSEPSIPSVAEPEVVELDSTIEISGPDPVPAAPQGSVIEEIIRPSDTIIRPPAALEEEEDDDDEDDDIDETLMERLVGLTEMFPDFVTNGSVSLVKGSCSLTTKMYSLSRSISWVIFSSATILFMPVMIETERLQLQDQQKAAKNQILLGPGAAVSGGPSLGPPPI